MAHVAGTLYVIVLAALALAALALVAFAVAGASVGCVDVIASASRRRAR